MGVILSPNMLLCTYRLQWLSPDLQQLDLHAALHVGLDLRPQFHPAFIQLLEDLQVLKGLIHL